MSNIPKSASYVGTVEFENGNKTAIWAYTLANGESAAYQSVNNGRAKRVSGGNFRQFVKELDFALNEEEAWWADSPNEVVLGIWGQIVHRF